jgi:FkbM family methyltransferase
MDPHAKGLSGTAARAVARSLALLVGLGLLACSNGETDRGGQRRDILGTEKKRYSQFDEELVIRDFFQDRRKGVFLDVGAAHPVRYSTSYYLEKHLGWTGIAIDALPRYATEYRKRRPRTRFFQYIVTDHSGSVEEFYHVPMAPGLSSTEEGRIFRGTELQQELIQVPTMTLDALLDAQGVAKLDFLSMDIEGGAPKALAAFDIQRFRPELVCIEMGDLEPELHRYFVDNGYRRLTEYDGREDVNAYYAPAD